MVVPSGGFYKKVIQYKQIVLKYINIQKYGLFLQSQTNVVGFFAQKAAAKSKPAGGVKKCKIRRNLFEWCLVIMKK